MLTAFVLALSMGYIFGFTVLYETTELSAKGIEQNYNGNEEDENAEKMKFKKSGFEVRTSIHSHVMTLSAIFLLVSGMLYFTKIPSGIKNVLMIEPFVSLVLTFGGIYFLWKEVLWCKYVIMVSGMTMHLVFSVSLIILIYHLTLKKSENVLH